MCNLFHSSKLSISILFLTAAISQISSQSILADIEGDTKIRGNVDIHNPLDSTSIFIGWLSGNMIDPSVAFGNSFLGVESGMSNDTGSVNSFFGYRAGKSNTTGKSNSFFGAHAGMSNDKGQNNLTCK